MSNTTQDYERITISLPLDISKDIEEIKKELNVSKSEIFKKAFEKFFQDYKKQKIRKAAEKMAKEYKTDKELTAFSSLDGEDFR
jgi:metal-responsive CopG/Arc/MetJ family transcriptional regulator